VNSEQARCASEKARERNGQSPLTRKYKIGLLTRDVSVDAEKSHKASKTTGTDTCHTLLKMQLSFLSLFFKTRSCYTVQAGFPLKILLPQPPYCWDYRSVPPCA
jgi:hypothetical protein